MSIPEVPSFSEFTSLVSLRKPEPNSIVVDDQDSATYTANNEEALSILEVADQALKIARKEWEAISKVSAETARCIGCEDWWRSSMKNVLRSCITANITVATAKKALSNAGSKKARDALKVKIMESHKGYHVWWIVPQISAK